MADGDDLRIEGLQFDATGAARYPDSGQVPDLSMTMNLPPEQGGEMEMMVIDESVYLRLPPEAGLPTPWVKVQLDGSDPFSAQMAPLIEQMSSSFDLEQSFEPMAAASSIEQGEADVIDGVDVTKYVVTVDVGEMPSDLPAGPHRRTPSIRRGDLHAFGSTETICSVATQMILADTSRRTPRSSGTANLS